MSMTKEQILSVGLALTSIAMKVDSSTFGQIKPDIKTVENVCNELSFTGKWLTWTDDRKDYCKCPKCGYGEEGEVEYGKETPYCPYCGANLSEGVDL